MVPKLVSGALQHCTFWMSHLSDTPISGLGVSTNELMTSIRCVWVGRNTKGALLGRFQKQCSNAPVPGKKSTPGASPSSHMIATCIWARLYCVACFVCSGIHYNEECIVLASTVLCGWGTYSKKKKIVACNFPITCLLAVARVMDRNGSSTKTSQLSGYWMISSVLPHCFINSFLIH